MHLNAYPASASFGDCAYGTATVGLQGATPALLVGQQAGGLFGPNWLDDAHLIYQNGGTGSGPYILQSYDVDSPALATEDASGQNFMAAGGGVWAAFLAGSGVRSNVTISSPTAPLAGAYVLDVNTSGDIALNDYQATAVGITVYDSSGAAFYTAPTVALTQPIVRLAGNILAYCDANGWHLRDVSDGSIPSWCPPLDSVNWIIPVTMPDGSLWVVERTASALRVREGFRDKAYVVQSAPIAFNPDAIALGAGVMRIGYCDDLGESLSSAVLVDVTLLTGANQVGVVSGGTIVFSPGTAFTYVTVPVGPNESTGDTGAENPPQHHPIANPQNNHRVTDTWLGFFRGLRAGLKKLTRVVDNIPKVPSAPAPAFGRFTFSGQPDVVATAPTDVANFASADGSVAVTLNPFTKTLDLSATGGALADATFLTATDETATLPNSRELLAGTNVSFDDTVPGARTVNVTAATADYVVLSNGVQPPTPVDDGAGNFIYVGYTP